MTQAQAEYADDTEDGHEDIFSKVVRMRRLNNRLITMAFYTSIFALSGIAFGFVGFMLKAKSESVAVDPIGRTYPVTAYKLAERHPK